MRGYILIPPPPVAHPSDPCWDEPVGLIEVEINDFNRHLVVEVIEEEAMITSTEETVLLQPKPLTVLKRELSCGPLFAGGTYAVIPWHEWKQLVKALHDSGICLPPTEEE